LSEKLWELAMINSSNKKSDSIIVRSIYFSVTATNQPHITKRPQCSESSTYLMQPQLSGVPQLWLLSALLPKNSHRRRSWEGLRSCICSM